MLAYGIAASLMFITPVAGKVIRGNKAVTDGDAASVIHQQIIQAINASTSGAFSEMKLAGKKKRTNKNKMGPRKKPICFTLFSEIVTQRLDRFQK